MKKIVLLFVLLNLLVLPGWGKINVVATLPYIGNLVHQVGLDGVKVVVLARGSRDPHFVTPRPSFIAKLRKADLLIMNGGQLEIGWLPPVIRQANNRKLGSGNDGLLKLIDFVEPMDIPVNVSRADGDVHPEGNPHFQLDPGNIPLLAKAIKERLCKLDPNDCEAYNKNLDTFLAMWEEKRREWAKGMSVLKGEPVIQYHTSFNYLLRRYGIEGSGSLEPLPGIPPTTRHIAQTIETIKKENVKLILQDVYHNPKTAKFVSSRSGVPMVVVPHDVDSVKGVNDIFELFDEIVRRLTSL